MKISTAIVLVTLAVSSSTSAFAGDYEDAAANQKYCMEQGDWAASMYDQRNDAVEVVDQLAAIDKMLVKRPNKKLQLAVFKKTTEYAFFLATSRADAYTRGWAICMDR